MEFVVSTLMKHLNLDQESAVMVMIAIHTKGGILISFPTLEKAGQVAAGISADARAGGHAFVCRTVSVD
jgi:ATP-dependent Clp protease adapter protein ClpS